MTVSLRSNIASLSAQSTLRATNNNLSKTYERLSSGLRINRASDDAAGLAVATSLKSDSRLMQQAVRNINDAVSAVNIFSSALSQMQDLLARQLELATQAANGSFSLAQRRALDTEADALVNEYNRIVNSISFNDIQLGSTAGRTMSFQAGITSDSSFSAVFGDGLGRAAGTGSFASPSTISTSVSALVKGDFNGDGIDDVGVYGQYDTYVRIFLGNENGSLNYVNTYTNLPISGTLSFTSGDFNNDGKTDILMQDLGSGSGSLRVLLSNGNGTFNISSPVSVDEITITSVDVGDFNGDGNLDIIQGSTNRKVLLGDGSGSFSAAATIVPGMGAGLRSTTGDFNGDGYDDVAVANNTTVKLYLGSSSGTFTEQASFAPMANISTILSGDFNSDGIDDLRVNNTTQNSLYLGSASGTFSLGFSGALSLSSGSLTSTFNIDINSDGYTDIANRSTTGAISYRLGNGDGTFGQQLTTSLGYSGSGTLLVGDYNNDDVDDIVAVGNVNIAKLSLANTSEVTTIRMLDLHSRESALKEIEVVNAAIDRVATETGIIGASLSRLEIALNNAQSSKEVFTTAAARIVDVDTAQETANMARLQILQKAGVAVLAQANLQPQIALRLLSIEK